MEAVAPRWFWCPYVAPILAVLQAPNTSGAVMTELRLVRLEGNGQQTF